MASSKDNKMGADCPKVIGEILAGRTTVEVTKEVTSPEGEVHTVTETISAFDFYSCEEAIKRLNAYLDSELAPEERDDVMKHLKICAPCLERFHFEKTLLLTMRERIHRTIAPLKLKERLSALMKNGE